MSMKNLTMFSVVGGHLQMARIEDKALRLKKQSLGCQSRSHVGRVETRELFRYGQ